MSRIKTLEDYAYYTGNVSHCWVTIPFSMINKFIVCQQVVINKEVVLLPGQNSLV